jgi:hypothetical protein
MTDESLTEQKLFDAVTELEIFSFVMGVDVVVGKAYSSPLRIDIHPSFYIFNSVRGSNKLMWKDHSTGESGNVFKLIALLHGLKYPDSLRWVNREMGIGLPDDYIDISEKGYARNVPKRIFSPSSLPTEYSQKVNSVKEFKFVYRFWEMYDFDYWSQYCITPETLTFYHVNAVDQVWMNDKFLFRSTKYEPVYNYVFVNEVDNTLRYKIYKPLSHRSRKWLSNCNVDVLPGYIQLLYLQQNGYVFDSNSFLVITKSLKDTMVLHELGILSISVNSETSGIPKYHLENIMKLGINKFLILYDNDEAGRSNALKLSQQYSIPAIEIPEEYQVKDISDLIKYYGKNTTKEFTQYFKEYAGYPRLQLR